MKSEREFEIENYLSGEMTDSERIDFESRLQSDKELSSLLEMYRTIDFSMVQNQKAETQALRETLDGLGKKYFITGDLLAQDNKAPVVPISAKRNGYARVLAVAASLVLIVGAYFVFFDKPDAKQLADIYLRENFTIISQTMDGAGDLLQKGIAAYNDKDYINASVIFDKIYAEEPDNTDALLYAGITNLASGNYNTAITNFDDLSSKKHLFSNPGLFLKAVALLKRNNPNDEVEAKKILEQVVAENRDNTVEAKKMLKHW